VSAWVDRQLVVEGPGEVIEEVDAV
jgi:hypothetical protein